MSRFSFLLIFILVSSVFILLLPSVVLADEIILAQPNYDNCKPSVTSPVDENTEVTLGLPGIEKRDYRFYFHNQTTLQEARTTEKWTIDPSIKFSLGKYLSGDYSVQVRTECTGNPGCAEKLECPYIYFSVIPVSGTTGTAQPESNCPRLARIPIFVQPPKGSQTSTYAVDLFWDSERLSNANYKDYEDKDVNVYFTESNNPNDPKIHTFSTDGKDSYYIRPISPRQKNTIQISGFNNLPIGTTTKLFAHLKVGTSDLCKGYEEVSLPINVTSSTCTSAGLKKGEGCLPDLQDPYGKDACYYCPTDSSCQPVTGSTSGNYACGGLKTWCELDPNKGSSLCTPIKSVTGSCSVTTEPSPLYSNPESNVDKMKDGTAFTVKVHVDDPGTYDIVLLKGPGGCVEGWNCLNLQKNPNIPTDSDNTLISEVTVGTNVNAWSGIFKAGTHEIYIVKSGTSDIYCTVSYDILSGKTATPPGGGGAPGGSAGGSTGKGTGKPCEGGQEGIETAIGCIPTDFNKMVEAISKLAMGMGGGIALLLMISGAFRMITSAGNPDAVKAGSEQFTSAIIGLLFIIFAVLLLKVIGVDILKIPGFV